jgi:tetratricopeptide (TPR) repeat protein
MTNSTCADYRICVFLVGVFLPVLVGCAPEQKAVELYVDAAMLSELNENEKAIQKLDTAVKLNDRFSLAYSLLGDVYQKINSYEKSAASYEKATKLNPWSFRDYFNLGRVYQVMEKFTNAVEAYEKACKLQPNHLEAHVNAAKCSFQIKDFDNALAYGQKAERIDPNVSEIQKLLGDIYETQKDYNRAIASYKRALEIDSNNPEIMISLAVAYLRTGNNEPAKELLTSAINLRPGDNTAYQYLGYCYLRLREQAVESYKLAMQKDSNTPGIETSLAEYLDKATENYSKAIEINSKDWEALRGLGVAYMLKAIG